VEAPGSSHQEGHQPASLGSSGAQLHRVSLPAHHGISAFGQVRESGAALAVLFGVADKRRARSVIQRTPVVPFGVPCFSPSSRTRVPITTRVFGRSSTPILPSRPRRLAMRKPSSWPSSPWSEQPRSLATHKENMVYDTGDVNTAINSDSQLWSVAGYLGSSIGFSLGCTWVPRGSRSNRLFQRSSKDHCGFLTCATVAPS